LLSYLGKKGRFAEKDALKIISDVIDGLKYLSEQSVIHRDLKPANILKSSTKWKIADFGFAIKSEN
jgi:serine/threonine protein kinase